LPVAAVREVARQRLYARREIAGNVDPEELANAGPRRNRLFECQFLVGSVGVEPSDAEVLGC
jgi:hypothetical protein